MSDEKNDSVKLLFKPCKCGGRVNHYMIQSHPLPLFYAQCQNCRRATKLYQRIEGVVEDWDSIDIEKPIPNSGIPLDAIEADRLRAEFVKMRDTLQYIATYGGTHCDGNVRDGLWCAERARQALASK